MTVNGHDRHPLEHEKAYYAAIDAVWLIDAILSPPRPHHGTGDARLYDRRHFRARDGALLMTLDEVVRAALADDLEMEV